MEDAKRPTDAVQPARPDLEELRAQALDLLDFPAVRQQVAGYAGFPLARSLALSLEPTYSWEEVEALQRETAEGVAFLAESSDISLYTSEDVAPLVERAALEGVLTGHELLAVAASLEVQHRARSGFLRMPDSTPILLSLAESIPDLDEVRRRIVDSIGSRGEVLDGATPVLGQLRRQVRAAYERVAGALERFITSPTGQEALQDQVVSMRGDRLVLQVKTELRHRIPGIVHDASNTGATVFVEPFETVDLGNDWRELALEEEREVAWVLRELSALVGDARSDIMLGTKLTARLDLIMARARYSASLGGVAALEPPGPGGPPAQTRPRPVRLVSARHPLLGEDTVPVTIQIDADRPVLVITGPNTGGKTVAMKTVGLLALMHQSGLHIPADAGSSLPVFDGVYADVGDHQSIQRSVSTFGSHMRNVIGILRHADAGSLVLLDELGTSTDPEEGSALAKAILNRLASEHITSISTTHHRSVAAHAQASDGMSNASVDLDANTLRPTYHLTLGAPGRSYAMSIAAHMGLTDDIMDDARSLLEPQHMLFEDWLKELQAERQELKARLQEADEARSRAESARMQMEARIADLELRREEAVRDISRELNEEFEEVRRRLQRAQASLSWTVSEDTVKKAAAEISAARDEMREAPSARRGRDPGVTRERLKPGDVVDIRGLNVQGKVASVPDEGQEVEVAIGSVRFRLDAHRLSPAEPAEDSGQQEAVEYDLGPLLPSLELDIRGMRVEEALIRVDEFLDKALRDGLSSVRIIHGKGTGALREAVREMLTDHRLAKSHSSEPPERGGDGATVVELV